MWKVMSKKVLMGSCWQHRLCMKQRTSWYLVLWKQTQLFTHNGNDLCDSGFGYSLPFQFENKTQSLPGCDIWAVSGHHVCWKILPGLSVAVASFCLKNKTLMSWLPIRNCKCGLPCVVYVLSQCQEELWFWRAQKSRLLVPSNFLGFLSLILFN